VINGTSTEQRFTPPSDLKVAVRTDLVPVDKLADVWLELRVCKRNLAATRDITWRSLQAAGECGRRRRNQELHFTQSANRQPRSLYLASRQNVLRLIGKPGVIPHYRCTGIHRLAEKLRIQPLNVYTHQHTVTT
jgi:hypothetical protein